MDKDFTIEKYSAMCQSLLSADYAFISVAQYLKAPEIFSKFVILRHDVDRSPLQALEMARVEAGLGIPATYYFRYTPHVFRPSVIRKIARMGHEIGYHYETLSKARGNPRQAIRQFRFELRQFRKICNTKTISMHGRPLSKWDNRDIWKEYDYRTFGLIGEAYLSLDFHEIAYLSDTGRAWNNKKFNVRDTVSGMALPQIRSTDELVHFMNHSGILKFCLLTHPNRWSSTPGQRMHSHISDTLLNRAKQGIKGLRGTK